MNDSSEIPVVILCGGEGTRIRDVSELVPKPLLDIGGRPILWHIMKRYGHYGHRRFVLCLGYKGELIKNFFLDYRTQSSDFTLSLRSSELTLHAGEDVEDWEITLADTGPRAMTGARVAAVRRYVESAPLFMLTYGDGVADLDLDALLDFHRAHGKAATLTGVVPPARFGVIEHDSEQQVREFTEKPHDSNGLINGGFMVFDAERIWEYLPAGDPGLILEREPLRQLAGAGELMVYPHSGFWHCMDTLRDYNQLNRFWAEGKAPWKCW